MEFFYPSPDKDFQWNNKTCESSTKSRKNTELSSNSKRRGKLLSIWTLLLLTQFTTPTHQSHTNPHNVITYPEVTEFFEANSKFYLNDIKVRYAILVYGNGEPQKSLTALILGNSTEPRPVIIKKKKKYVFDQNSKMTTIFNHISPMRPNSRGILIVAWKGMNIHFRDSQELAIKYMFKKTMEHIEYYKVIMVVKNELIAKEKADFVWQLREFVRHFTISRLKYKVGNLDNMLLVVTNVTTDAVAPLDPMASMETIVKNLKSFRRDIDNRHYLITTDEWNSFRIVIDYFLEPDRIVLLPCPVKLGKVSSRLNSRIFKKLNLFNYTWNEQQEAYSEDWQKYHKKDMMEHDFENDILVDSKLNLKYPLEDRTIKKLIAYEHGMASNIFQYVGLCMEYIANAINRREMDTKRNRNKAYFKLAHNAVRNFTKKLKSYTSAIRTANLVGKLATKLSIVLPVEFVNNITKYEKYRQVFQFIGDGYNRPLNMSGELYYWLKKLQNSVWEVGNAKYFNNFMLDAAEVLKTDEFQLNKHLYNKEYNHQSLGKFFEKACDLKEGFREKHKWVLNVSAISTNRLDMFNQLIKDYLSEAQQNGRSVSFGRDSADFRDNTFKIPAFSGNETIRIDNAFIQKHAINRKSLVVFSTSKISIAFGLKNLNITLVLLAPTIAGDNSSVTIKTLNPYVPNKAPNGINTHDDYSYCGPPQIEKAQGIDGYKGSPSGSIILIALQLHNITIESEGGKGGEGGDASEYGIKRADHAMDIWFKKGGCHTSQIKWPGIDFSDFVFDEKDYKISDLTAIENKAIKLNNTLTEYEDRFEKAFGKDQKPSCIQKEATKESNMNIQNCAESNTTIQCNVTITQCKDNSTSTTNCNVTTANCKTKSNTTKNCDFAITNCANILTIANCNETITNCDITTVIHICGNKTENCIDNSTTTTKCKEPKTNCGTIITSGTFVEYHAYHNDLNKTRIAQLNYSKLLAAEQQKQKDEYNRRRTKDEKLVTFLEERGGIGGIGGFPGIVWTAHKYSGELDTIQNVGVKGLNGFNNWTFTYESNYVEGFMYLVFKWFPVNEVNYLKGNYFCYGDQFFGGDCYYETEFFGNYIENVRPLAEPGCYMFNLEQTLLIIGIPPVPGGILSILPISFAIPWIPITIRWKPPSKWECCCKSPFYPRTKRLPATKPLPVPPASFFDPSYAIADYKKFALQHWGDHNSKEIDEFLQFLTTGKVAKFYNAKLFVRELIAIIKGWSPKDDQDKTKRILRELDNYRERIIEYSKSLGNNSASEVKLETSCKDIFPECKDCLNFVCGTGFVKKTIPYENTNSVLMELLVLTQTMIGTIHDMRSSFLVIDIRQFLTLLKEELKDLNDLEAEKRVNDHTQKFNDRTQKKIEFIKDIVKITLKPAIKNILGSVKDEMNKLFSGVSHSIVEIREQKAKAKRNAIFSVVCGVLDVAGTVLSIFGPEAAAAGSGATFSSGILKTFVISNLNSEIFNNTIAEMNESDQIIFENYAEIKREVKPTIDALENLNNTLALLPPFEEKHSILKMIPEYILTLNDPNKNHQEIINSGKPLTKLLSSVNTKSFSETEKKRFSISKMGVDLSSKLPDMYEAAKGNFEKLSQSLEAYAKFDKDEKLLIKLINYMQEQTIPMFEKAKERVLDYTEFYDTDKIKEKLKGLNMDLMIKSMQSQMQKIAASLKAFKLEFNFENIFSQLQDVMKTITDIKVEKEAYAENQQLVTLMGQLANFKSKDYGNDTELANLMITCKEVVKTVRATWLFSNAFKAFKNYVFPHAHYLEGFLPSYNYSVENFTDCLSEVNANVNRMITVYDKEKSTIVSGRNYHAGEFTNAIFDPFFVWEPDETKHLLNSFFNGTPIYLHADISQSSPTKEAIRFVEINLEMDIRLNNGDQNITAVKDLKRILDRFMIEMTHTGNSYFRIDSKNYVMSTQPVVLSRCFANYSDGTSLCGGSDYFKVRNGNRVLSPYTTWKFQLKATSDTTGTSDFRNLLRYNETRIFFNLTSKNGSFFDKLETTPDTTLLDQYYQSYEIKNEHQNSQHPDTNTDDSDPQDPDDIENTGNEESGENLEPAEKEDENIGDYTEENERSDFEDLEESVPFENTEDMYEAKEWSWRRRFIPFSSINSLFRF